MTMEMITPILIVGLIQQSTYEEMIVFLDHIIEPSNLHINQMKPVIEIIDKS